MAACLPEGAPTIVQVQPVLEGGRHVRELAAATDHVEVGVTISGRVEEHGSQIFRHPVLLEQPLVAPDEPAGALLDEELTRLILGAPDERVVQSVTVHIRHGHERPFGGEHLRHQLFPVEIDERVLPVHEPQRDAVRDVGEERRGRPPSDGLRRGRLRLPYRETLVRRDVHQHADAPVRPLDRHRLDRVEPADPEGQHVVHTRLESARRHQLLKEQPLSAPQRHLRPDAEAVGAFSFESDLEVTVVQQRPGVVAIDEGLLVDVVHDQIERTVAVQITVGRATGKARRVQAPGRARVREGQAPVVPECIVWQHGRTRLLDESQEVDPLALGGCPHRLVVGQEGDVVLRGYIPEDAVRDMDILVTVLIEIRDERAPAPVCARHAGHLPDLAERPVAVVQMERVARELMVIVVLQLGLVAGPVLERGCRLEAVVVLRQHVGHVDVQPPVVVDVGYVQPHRGQADGGHLPVEQLGESSISVVDVEIVPLEEVVGDVDVRPAVAVHVAHGDTQTEGDLAPEDPGRLAHVEEAPADVAIEFVPSECMAHVADVSQPEARHRRERVVDQVQVQVSVTIVIEERGVGRIALVRDAVRGRHLGEGGHPVGVQTLVDVQLVGPALARHVSGVADVDVEESVTVDVGEGDPRRPEPLARDPRPLGHIREAEVTLVQVQPVCTEVRREQEFRQTVAGEVAQRHPAAVVVVAIGEDIQLASIGEAVLEADACIAGG